MSPRSARIFALALASGTIGATPRVELSAPGPSLSIEVSDDATATIDVAGDAIVPVRWDRAGRSRATLPLLLMPGATSPVALDVAGDRVEVSPAAATPRVRIDPAAYATTVEAPRPERRRALGAAVTATLALLLATRLRRPRDAVASLLAVTALGVAGIVLASRRPDVARVETDRVTWLLARRDATVRLPVGGAWVPVVESTSHLRALAPRLHVAGDQATLEVTLSRGGRVAVAREPR